MINTLIRNGFVKQKQVQASIYMLSRGTIDPFRHSCIIESKTIFTYNLGVLGNNIKALCRKLLH